VYICHYLRFGQIQRLVSPRCAWSRICVSSVPNRIGSINSPRNIRKHSKNAIQLKYSRSYYHPRTRDWQRAQLSDLRRNSVQPAVQLGFQCCAIIFIPRASMRRPSDGHFLPYFVRIFVIVLVMEKGETQMHRWIGVSKTVFRGEDWSMRGRGQPADSPCSMPSARQADLGMPAWQITWLKLSKARNASSKVSSYVLLYHSI